MDIITPAAPAVKKREYVETPDDLIAEILSKADENREKHYIVPKYHREANPLVAGKKILSYSIMSRLMFMGNEISICPHEFYRTTITRDYERPLLTADGKATPMLCGIYFESCVAGGGKGQQVKDLPRLKLSLSRYKEMVKQGLTPMGERCTDHKRIDEQVLRTKMIFDNKGVIIIEGKNTQQTVYARWNDEWLIAATPDIFPTQMTWDGEDIICTLELKLTANINSTWGKFSWGNSDDLDITQALLGLYICGSEIDPVLNPQIIEILGGKTYIPNFRFFYYVADYKKKDIDSKFIEVKRHKHGSSVDRFRELEQSIRRCIALLEAYEANGWQKMPKYKRCKDCLVAFDNGGDCKEAEMSEVL